jgi:hypothetical protein
MDWHNTRDEIMDRIDSEKFLLAHFPSHMAARLKANRDKGNWSYSTPYLIKLLAEEFSELLAELTQPEIDMKKVDHEAADLAVICAFISWNVGNLFSLMAYDKDSYE